MRFAAQALTLLLACALALAIAGPASGYSGTSLDDNVSPKSQVHGLAERWPSNRFGLDHHVGDILETPHTHIPGSGGLVDAFINVPRTSVNTDALDSSWKYSAASAIWTCVRWGTNLVITLLTFALSLDLLSGPTGLLAPVASSVNRLYHELNTGWMAVAVIALGLYVLVFAVMRRQITQTFGKVAVSFVMVSFALLLMTQWQWTIGATSKYTNDASLAIIATVTGDDTANARTAASDALFDTVIIEPWMVLNFGGLEHCVDKDGKSVKPNSDECDPKNRINNRKYVKRWLDAGPANSQARQLEYEAIRDAKIPDASKISDAGLPANAFDGYRLTAADTPAVDVQQREMSDDRLVVAGLIGVGALGMWCLIGGLAVSLIVFKILAVLLFGFVGVIAIVALFPGAGHRAFWAWFERLALALTLGVWYALVLAFVLAISHGLAARAPDIGWKLAYVVLAIFWWSVFLMRKRAVSMVLGALPGSTGLADHGRSAGDHARDWYYKSKMLLPAMAGVGAGVGAVIHGTEKHPDRSVAGLAGTARGGVSEAREKVKEYAAGGHTERQRETADLHGRALAELEGEHKRNVTRHRDEQQRRARRDELGARQRAAADSAIPDDVLRSMDLPSNALSRAEARELNLLESTAMPTEDFQTLGATVNDVERRREDTGGQPFSTEQISARAAQIREREDAQQDLARRAKHYTEWEYGDLFGPDDDLLGPYAGTEETKRRERPGAAASRGRRRRHSHRRDGE